MHASDPLHFLKPFDENIFGYKNYLTLVLEYGYMIIREANFQDVEQIANLHADSWKKFYRGIWTDAYLDGDVLGERLEVWSERLESPKENQRIFVASYMDTIVGFACFYVNDDPTFGTLLDNLHVSSTYQGSGVGRLLIKQVAAVNDNVSTEGKFYLWVFEKNIQARRFYENLGGINYETVVKENPDGTKSMVCRYVWQHIHELAEHP